MIFPFLHLNLFKHLKFQEKELYNDYRLKGEIMSKLDESKFRYLSPAKLHKQYLTKFLTEIWNVPLDQLEDFIREYYPNPSAMELVELNELKRIVKLNLSKKLSDGTEIEPELLSEDDLKGQIRRYDRMYGKEVQTVELTGAEGKAIELTSMSKEEVNEALKDELSKVMAVMKKVKKRK